MENLKLAAPWTTLYREIEALFEHDSQVKVFFDEKVPAIKIFVGNPIKAECLANILPMKKTYGNVSVSVMVVPPNNNGYDLKVMGESDYAELFKGAFDGNDAFSNIVTIDDGIFSPMTFVQFKLEVVQFYNDNTSDLHGLTSTLYHNIAMDIFELPGVFFSLAVVDK